MLISQQHFEYLKQVGFEVEKLNLRDGGFFLFWLQTQPIFKNHRLALKPTPCEIKSFFF
jgi:hypothetical protein